VSIKPTKTKARTGQVADHTQLRDKRVPAEVQRLIRKNIVDISGASKFFKTKANVAVLLKGFVEALPNSQFRLLEDFNVFFHNNLAVVLNVHSMKPADALAEALFLLGRQWAKIGFGNLPIASLPTDEFLRTHWKEADTWEAFVRSGGSIAEIWWHNLSANLDLKGWIGGSDPDDFEVRVDCNFDATKPPQMLFRIRGKPAASMMNWWMVVNSSNGAQKGPETKEVRERTTVLLDSIVGALKLDLGLTQPKKGRPRQDFGENAAYLLDHEGRTLGWIAKELSKLPDNCSPSARRQSFDRIRNAAKNYYELLGNDYTAVTTARVRQRVIRIPPNPNLVKSE